MRKHALRSLILAVALVGVALPVVNMTHMAAACSTPTCSSSGTTTTIADTNFSELTVGTPTAVCGENTLTGQHDYAFVCNLTFGISDLRGNDQGFVASVESSGFSNSLAVDSVTGMPVTIPPSDISNSGVITMTPLSCVGVIGVVGCEPEIAAPTLNQPLSSSSPLPVIVGCPVEKIGKGTYSNAVALDVLVKAGTPEGEVYGEDPLSWTGSFTVTVTEGTNINFLGFGCPAGSSA